MVFVLLISRVIRKNGNSSVLFAKDNTHPTELVGYGCAYIWHIIILGSN